MVKADTEADMEEADDIDDRCGPCDKYFYRKRSDVVRSMLSVMEGF